MKRKSDVVREQVSAGDYKEALRIAKGFRLGITAEERTTMTRAYECIVHPDFYKQIGVNTETEILKGVEVLKRKYGQGEKMIEKAHDNYNVEVDVEDEERKQILKTVKQMQIKKIIIPCPRCGYDRMCRENPARNALSRFADVYICDECGTDEALRDFYGCSIPLKDWKIMKAFTK